MPQDQVWPVSSLELDVQTVPVNLWGLVAEVALQFGATPSMQLPHKVVSSGVCCGRGRVPSEDSCRMLFFHR